MVKGTRGKERSNLAYAAGLVIGWHSHVGDGREKEVVDAWRRLAARPPYWEPLTDATSLQATVGTTRTAPVQAEPEALTAPNTMEASAERSGVAVAKPAPSRRRIVRRS